MRASMRPRSPPSPRPSRRSPLRSRNRKDRRPMPRIHRPRSIAATSVLVAGLFLARAAHAQSAEAEQLFREGDRLMTEGKTVEACDAFEGSNRIEPRAGTLIRLGECREKNHQLASAW